MNLDELKIQLNEEADTKAVSPNELSKMINRSSDSVIAGIRRNLGWEAVVSFVCSFACLYFAATASYSSVRIYLYVFAGLCLLFTVVLGALLKMITEKEKQVVSLTEKIRSVLHIIRSYARNYFRFSIGLIPVSILLAVALALHDAQIDQSVFSHTRFMIPFSVIIVILSAAIYFFNKWYIHKLYGRYTDQLQKHLEELETE